MTILEIKNLHHTYDNENYALEDINLSINDGEIVSILGPSGCGKTTLLRVIAGLERQSKGTIKINEQIISNEKFMIPPEKRSIGLVVQDKALFPHLNVINNVIFGIQKNKEKYNLAKNYLDIFKVEELAEKYPHEIIGATLSTIILGETVSRPMWADLYELGAILAMGIIIVIAAALLPYMVIFGLMIGAGAGIIYGVGYFFTKELWLLDPTMPLFMLTLVGLHGIFNRFVKEFQLKQQIKKQFGTYLSPAMVQKLQKNPELLKLGGDTRHMTFLFCDIRGFTPISEQYKTNPQGLTELVNRFLTPMTDIIMENDGTIDKYMGDCIMAFWNAPLDVPDQEGKAVKSAVKMLEHLKVLNEELEGDGLLPINIGIGINSGSVVVGNMGSNQRFDYSVLGDAVNLAARLEGQSKGYGVKTIIGEDTAKEIDDMFAVLELDKIAVKGKTEGVKIFTVLGEHKWWNENSNYILETQQHDKMLKLYRQKHFAMAARMTESLKGSFRGIMDSYYETWIERCEEMNTKELPDNWDGTYVATTK